MQNMENRKEKRRMGKLIVIEGTDSSGKETQTKKLFERLLNEKYNVKKISQVSTVIIILPPLPHPEWKAR